MIHHECLLRATAVIKIPILLTESVGEPLVNIGQQLTESFVDTSLTGASSDSGASTPDHRVQNER